MKDFALQFNYLSNCLTWYLDLNEAKFIAEHLPLELSNVSIDLSSATRDIFQFFIGKVGSGLLTWFLPIPPFLTNEFLLKPDTTQRSLQNLLYRAWPYFLPREKSLFLQAFFRALRNMNSFRPDYNENVF